MNFYPIRFITEMVQALKAGNKTETRRDMRPQPELNNDKFYRWNNLSWDSYISSVRNVPLLTPYGLPGDVLWVRETYGRDLDNKYIFKADTGPREVGTSILPVRWTANQYMPKEACRFFLLVKAIHVERLHSITSADALAEGVKKIAPGHYHNYLPGTYPHTFSNPQLSYFSLWQKISGPDSWLANPWVWVIQFEQIEKPKNFLV